ncbi:FeoC-like transcriptional regulator [Corynebacterium confusum]|uniref:FeoC-like transcriptional regulator n=1 Tax=uncultured Corynebacterium sp. TaxID=159447 RepID=UPI0025DA21AB|nr:FeoC-like transcriptional regulator [uncultured Corynebacterium sp.]
MTDRRTSPLATVRELIGGGVTSRAEVAARSGLDAGVVDAILDHLLATGGLVPEPVPGCPSGGCGGCAAAGTCPSAAGGARRGPVLLKLIN